MDYLSYFGLTAEPFSNAPLSRFYYGSRQHTDALERLRYAASTMKGLAILIGDIGLGKTTLARRMLEALPEAEYEAAMLVIVHAGITPNWLLKRIAIQLAVPDPADDKLTILSQLYQRLVEIHEGGKKAVVLIDEAQMLATRELMEEFRGLLNLEVPERKLISFIFFGLPEIEQNLRLDPPLAQRIALRYHLKPFGVEDTHAYVRHRLTLAGAGDREIFAWSALDEVYRFARGVPRLINTLCDNLLLEMFFSKTQRAEADLVRAVAQNLGLTPTGEVEPLAPEVIPRVEEPALAGGPGASAIVAVNRQDEHTPEAEMTGVVEPDSIAAQVANEPLIDQAPALPEYGAETTERSVVQVGEPAAPAPIVVASNDAAVTCEVPSEGLPGENSEALSVEVEATTSEVSAAAPLAVASSVDAEDRGPPALPLTRVERTTVDIADPLAFLSTTVVPEAPPSVPSPWQGTDEVGADGEVGDVPELAPTDMEIVEAGDDELAAAPGVEIEVEVAADEALLAEKTPPRPMNVSPKPPRSETSAAIRPEPESKPAAKASVTKPAAPKSIDLSDIDAFLADLNLPPRKK